MGVEGQEILSGSVSGAFSKEKREKSPSLEIGGGQGLKSRQNPYFTDLF
jgi:hypothetical protein